MKKKRRPPPPEKLVADEGPSPGGVGETVAHRLERCIERLEDPELAAGWVVHEVRKDLKRVRALLRLSGDELPTRRLEKRCAAAARKLSHLRDNAVLGETLARLRARADARERKALDAVIDSLAEDDAAAPQLPRPVALEVADALRKVRNDCASLSFERMDATALDAGLANSWSDTAIAFRQVVDDPVTARFHDFRKAVKRELHQRELSDRPLDPAERSILKKLADVLGELQDLTVLRERLRAEGLWRGPVRTLTRRTMRELKARTLRLGMGRYPEGES
ncbi:MAG: CHAD domain-containing protein [Gammaproteobacteria bacterium]